MPLYRVTVATGSFPTAATSDAISLTLVGSRGESGKRRLDREGAGLLAGAVDECQLSTHEDLGEILMVRLHKEPYAFFPEDSWYCSSVAVEGPGQRTHVFPCYRWMEGYLTETFREGTAKKVTDDRSLILLEHRCSELKCRQELYRWKDFQPGCPRCIDIDSMKDLNSDAKYSLVKLAPPMLIRRPQNVEIKLEAFRKVRGNWKSLQEYQRALSFVQTPISEYVSQHWREDSFFGYQFLNGAHPNVIRRCNKIPSNFPVTGEMVATSLGGSTNLEDELKEGNIFIVDYKILDGIPANVINEHQQYITAPMCLLYSTPQGELIPIAIQLCQNPGPESPIFLPSDSEWDWTLAKMWVRSGEFHVHQALSHVLHTHLLGEVFCVSTLRQLPTCHPLYKLLIPHMQYTLQINVQARAWLLKAGGILDQVLAAGGPGLPLLLKRGLATLTYASLCLPEDIRARGLESLPNFYYRDDGLKIWNALGSFVSSVVNFYYESDCSVQQDTELQSWVAEIFQEGLLGRASSGFPSALHTCTDLKTFLTMVIFTCSAQHAAVNSGQFDFLSWQPNGPASMRNPPPSSKGTVTLRSILETLPEVNSTFSIILALWMLGREPGEMSPLGTYPDQHFTEEEPQRCISAFQKRLAEISCKIDRRNSSLELKYNYLNPRNIENSISI
ncbi:hydroperoxide isomerase ALOXE3 isoform X1 [Rhinatrema bivittatum]|uniref:hydroperoxide isomerase ALOXE3 isoform X1 n=1 Tax=Rhinatrema bivittatum TaxID=194408 RepID=UPI001127FEDA|nr:hydroperoxide isomerase ALOXE3 isoform X1 [Rhinatrema bivittatum]